MSEHAPLSPSSAERWVYCPGSVALCRDIPPEPDSEYSLEGTRAHEAAEAILNGKKPNATRVMLDHLQPYLDICLDYTLHHATTYVGIEEKVYTQWGDVWGTADFLAITGDKLHVIDLKYGAGVRVGVRRNLQLVIYALGAMRTTPNSVSCKTIVTHVVQPRAGGEIHRSNDYSRDTLRWIAEEIIDPAVKAIKAGSDELRSGSHCRFCPAKATCPQLDSEHREAVLSMLETPAEDLDYEAMAEILKTADAVSAYLKAVRARAFSAAEGGAKIPGWKIVSKLGNRRYKDVEHAAQVLELHLDNRAYAEPLPLSPAQAERLIYPGFLENYGLVERPEGKALVPDSDSRSAHVTFDDDE